MPPVKKRSSSKKRKGGYTRAWSNSVGTRYENQYWINPTVGRGKSIRNKAVSSAEATACMAVALNAFSDRTMQPRFPDGKASESVGMKYQMINEIEQARGEEIEIIFFPGLNTCVHIRGATSKSLGQVTSAPNQAQTKVQRITTHITGIVAPNSSDGSGTPDGVVMKQQNERAVAKWRIVSYGLLLSLVNNSEENDGWWEACRITVSNDAREYMVMADTANTTASQPFTFVPDVPRLTSSEMLNQASYTTGKLRNIHNVLFQLNPEFEDREFVDLADEVFIKTENQLTDRAAYPLDDEDGPSNAGTATYGASKLLRQGVLSTRIQDEAVAQFIDTAFDAIYIKIHGVDDSTGRSPSRLTCHSVMNQEIVYDESALNAKFHQGSVYHHAHARIKGTPAAGQPNKVNNFA